MQSRELHERILAAGAGSLEVCIQTYVSNVLVRVSLRSLNREKVTFNGSSPIYDAVSTFNCTPICSKYFPIVS